MKNKFFVVIGLIAFVVIGVAASKPEVLNERNLKVLPKDISNTDLDSVMETYAKQLNVGPILKILRRTIRPGYSREGASRAMNAKDMIR